MFELLLLTVTSVLGGKDDKGTRLSVTIIFSVILLHMFSTTVSEFKIYIFSFDNYELCGQVLCCKLVFIANLDCSEY